MPRLGPVVDARPLSLGGGQSLRRTRASRSRWPEVPFGSTAIRCWSRSTVPGLAVARIEALVAMTTSRGAAAGPAASSRAAATGSSATSSASPWRTAASASNRMPNSSDARATCGPTARCNIHVAPPPGWMPSFWNRGSNNAAGPAIRTSAASARFSPAPTAAPLTAAIVGKAQLATARKPS